MINNSLVSQLVVHVDTTVVTTWEAAPVEAPASPMETAAMTTTVSTLSLKAKTRSHCTLLKSILHHTITTHCSNIIV